MSRTRKVPSRHRSNSGRWIFNELEQWVEQGKRPTPRRRYPVWENTRLLRARNREEAYRKAMKLGREGHPSKTAAGEWRFVGISMLLPVYEDIEDGAEILWTHRGSPTQTGIRRLVKSRRQLPVFQDDDGR